MDDQSDGFRRNLPQRMEILTGGVGRRRWSTSLKAQIVAESLAPDAVVADIARRHGARSSQVFGWRKDAREGKLALPADVATNGSHFTPVIIADTTTPAPRRHPPPESGAIEIESPGVTVRIRGAADAVMVEAIVRALRA
jgi:transposase